MAALACSKGKAFNGTQWIHVLGFRPQHGDGCWIFEAVHTQQGISDNGCPFLPGKDWEEENVNFPPGLGQLCAYSAFLSAHRGA